jgi:glucosamine 6-phosphate synthetase-like amidotransferase/phosphosugar isomerase protein
LKTSEIRGQDGTGITILRDGQFITHRWNCKASEITDFPELKTNDIVIGQNRLAIFGLDPSNNQPLVTDRYALIHNGNLYDFEKAFETYGLPRTYQVDTELILRLIEKFNKGSWRVGPPDTELGEDVRDMAESVKGDFACLLLDAENQMLAAFRRNKPLYGCVDGDSLYFFSTERIGQKVFKDAPGFFELSEVPEVCTVKVKENVWSRLLTRLK